MKSRFPFFSFILLSKQKKQQQQIKKNKSATHLIDFLCKLYPRTPHPQFYFAFNLSTRTKDWRKRKNNSSRISFSRSCRPPVHLACAFDLTNVIIFQKFISIVLHTPPKIETFPNIHIYLDLDVNRHTYAQTEKERTAKNPKISNANGLGEIVFATVFAAVVVFVFFFLMFHSVNIKRNEYITTTTPTAVPATKNNQIIFNEKNRNQCIESLSQVLA